MGITMTRENEGILESGEATYREAREETISRGPSPETEMKLRRSLAVLRSAMDHLEDTPLFEEAHRVLDEAGELARTAYPDGCHLEYRDNGYFHGCPVALAHSRVALSPELLVREAECSVCHGDPRTCDHIPGEIYNGQVCHRRITRVDILDIMLVGRPATPDARIQEISIPTPEIARSIGEKFKPGIPVLCDRCLKPCSGVARNFED
ncbi:hypothetical protein JNB_01640 [Janibacter sp. HTCC2649]|nr:hypothetical protein JNB_01640 [Janibacter sp. HTCC2649]